MWDFLQAQFGLTKRRAPLAKSRTRRPPSRKLEPELLEDRQLLTASLQPIANISVPALQGYTVPLLSSSTGTDPQTFVVTSSNPDIAVTSAQGEFWTIDVSYTDPTTPANSFTGSLTFQMFQSLTPKTVSEITTLIDDGYFVDTGKYFNRVASGFPNPTGYVVQGGSPTLTGQDPDPPVTYGNEDVQQLAFTGSDQLAMGYTGAPGVDSSQFFITTGSPNAQLGYNYTIFGQLVSGQTTLAEITQIPVTANSFTGENSEPVNPLTITSTSLSSTNPNGVAIIDTTQAKPGETATITVTAMAGGGSEAVQSFNVTVGAYAGATSSSFIGNVNFKPYANTTVSGGSSNTAQKIQLAGQNTYPDTSVSVPLTYSLVSSPQDGTISDFNASTGTFTYTPNVGFSGTDTFQYRVTATGPNSTAAAATSNPGTVTISVAPQLVYNPPPPVVLTNVELVTNKKHQVVGVTAIFSGALDFTEANNKAFYRMATPGKRGSYTAKNAGIIRLKRATYVAGSDSVTLTPNKPFTITVKKAVQLLISGAAPSGLQDSYGRNLDATAAGQAGSNAIAILSKHSVTIQVP
jgi:cyclophilin family peptidyl-prolyl cis-trans isomerase